jgi:hypothetical protein
MEGSSESMISLVLEEVLGDAKNYYLFEENINKVGVNEIRELAKNSEYSCFKLLPK